MSLALLERLNGSRCGPFAEFIANFKSEGKKPRIAWYPSSGQDFRSVLYLDRRFSQSHPSDLGEDPVPPDLFLHTDYYPWQQSQFLDSRLIHTDSRTTVSVQHIEELPRLHTALHREVVDFPRGSSATNRVLFLNVEVRSDTLGTFEAPVLYAFVENESFAGEVLHEAHAQLSHIIHVRYGGGCFGGGMASGHWIRALLKKLGCEVFINDGCSHEQPGDLFAVQRYPHLFDGSGDSELKRIRTLPGHRWSNHGDVGWDLVL